jgi:hypothetical protein
MKPTARGISLAVGLALTAAGVVAVMSQSPAALARTNGVPVTGPIAEVSSAYQACQAHEVLPRGTTAIRLSLEAMYGPSVRVRVVRKGELLTSGSQGSGWSRQSVTVPVKPRARTFTGVSVCFAFAPKDELVDVKGSSPGPGVHAAAIRVEYLRPGRRSWWSLASSVARRMSFGRATSGLWIVAAVAAAMLALTAIVSWLLIRDAR